MSMKKLSKCILLNKELYKIFQIYSVIFKLSQNISLVKKNLFYDKNQYKTPQLCGSNVSEVYIIVVNALIVSTVSIFKIKDFLSCIQKQEGH